ncbi:hypothetical protein BbINS_04180 [Bartonella bacilliformis INS]|uniref:Uncharacterized protein n=2 Tax=Bartonella bacilliformis TaxID=774 RepID=A1UT65_BARBK|nr:hypothetical protein BARBAKC583_0883 [Bartonella bacilliformis KC583]EKS43626.1 hypothetical protein BbINS_04180 [Bartonella bacilliformis INS]
MKLMAYGKIVIYRYKKTSGYTTAITLEASNKGKEAGENEI